MPTLPFHPVIELAFDPIVTLGDWHVRLQTIGLAVVIFVALLLAARIASRTPVHAGRPPEAIDPATGDPNHLRRDDLLYIAVAALPGAVVGGRLGWALVHLEYVTANPGALLDPAVGGFGLPLAVVGGTLTAALVATLLDTPIPRWLHALILPLLFALAGGKLAMVLGGDGQGLPWDGPWATAYLGAGPWLSLAPAVPSHPSQAYEALATAGVIVVAGAPRGAGLFRGAKRLAVPAGHRAVGGRAHGRRVHVARPAVIGPLALDQVLCSGSRSSRSCCSGPASSWAGRGRVERSARAAPGSPGRTGRTGPIRRRDRASEAPAGRDPVPRADGRRYSGGHHPRLPASAGGDIRVTQLAEPAGSTSTSLPTIGHWIGGTLVAGTSGRSGPVFDPATGARRRGRLRVRRGGRRGRRRRQGRLPRLAGDVALEAHGDHVPHPEPGRPAPARSSRRFLTAEHGKVPSDALGEIARGIENLEFATACRSS